ncbi:MAG: hypothetical protein L6N96_07240 [Candidatus Methylarchaceae archaeon HK02M2]|nr:hypothetical protein [Candidatus Methylarchaceae archaeon HK02M2]
MTLLRSKSPKKGYIIKGLEARIEAKLDKDLAQITHLAFEPDLLSKSRLKVEIVHNEGRLILNIKGGDISQLRAGINSYLRLIGMIVKLFEGVKKN